MTPETPQIVIPMTGEGSRFRAAGYTRLKPFIEVHGTPMIEWVTRLFPGSAARILFICRQDHLDGLAYVLPELRRIAPEARVVALDAWRKQGPVADILRAAPAIDPDAPVIVSYCDFYMQWDYAGFLDGLAARDPDGAVPCYTGFHPHLLVPANLYASCRVDAQDHLIEIREKHSMEPDKTRARHSPGIYYMRSGAMLLDYYRRLMATDQAINGEFYASLPYNLMVADGLRVWCPCNVARFCQWGTPADLEDYLYWTGTLLSARRRAAGDDASGGAA